MSEPVLNWRVFLVKSFGGGRLTPLFIGDVERQLENFQYRLYPYGPWVRIDLCDEADCVALALLFPHHFDGHGHTKGDKFVRVSPNTITGLSIEMAEGAKKRQIASFVLRQEFFATQLRFDFWDDRLDYLTDPPAR